MKKIYSIGLFALALALILNASPVAAATSAGNSAIKQPTKVGLVKKVRTKAKVKAVVHKTKYKTTMDWDASALKILSNFAGFDYSNVVRNAYIKKVEDYARRNNIKVITADVIDSIRE